MKPQKNLARRRALGFKARMAFVPKRYDKMADFMTRYFGTVSFFMWNAVFFVVWIVINVGLIEQIPIFDPYPFNFLTMFVSLEAIFLSVIVLISQNRASDIADMREELDFEINVEAEQEITHVLKMLEEIHKHLGLDYKRDRELRQMKRAKDIKKIGDEIIESNKT